MKIKLSDYVARFLKKQGIKHVWAVTGGASIHLMHSCAKEGIEVICPHHEQAGAMAADAYSRVTNNLGCAMGTSGPGATNMVTGIAGAYFDSVPVLYITGQVARERMRGNTGVRQLGFQETDIISIVQSITKYCRQVCKATDIRCELEKAVYIAKSGRPGPVLIDIPDDIQREMIDPDDLAMYAFGNTYTQNNTSPIPETSDIKTCVRLLKRAKRPVLILGWGVRLAKAELHLMSLIEKLGIPVCPSWGMMDYLPTNHELKVGGFGINGSRASNFTVQNADFILAVGARLSTRETGNSIKDFARGADVVVVDIDSSELGKFPTFGKNIIPIKTDAKYFVKYFLNELDNYKPDIKEWREKIKVWKKKYDPHMQIYQSYDLTDPYLFVDRLSRNMREGDIMTVDTGCALPWMMQAFNFKKGQRLFHDFNNTAMGWAVPAAIGAYFATPNRRIVCIVGDGSFMMNLQELATIRHHNLPIKIFLLNNNGYSMVRQTESEWLNDKNMGTGNEALSFPNYHSIADAFEFQYSEIEKNYQLDGCIRWSLNNTQPTLCNVIIPEDSKVWPKLKFGKPIEDSEPLLPRDEFKANMIIDPLPGWDKV